MYKILLSTVFLITAVYGLPESPHPYPNNFDDTKIFSSPGALALEIKFSKETFTEAGHDFIVIKDGQYRLVGKYSGWDLANQRILIEGNCVQIQLVTDETNAGYGYCIIEIRAIFSNDHFQARDLDYSNADNLFNDDLKQELYNLIKDHVCLGYTPARVKMFGEIDNEDGYVRCVYTARWVQTYDIPDGNDMNTEHTWPKSLGASEEPAKSDLYHLFPTDSYTNQKRDSYPFGFVETEYWSKGGSVLGEDSEGDTVFMPRPDHRGNAARAIFYFAIRYRMSISNYQEAALKQWHQDDPVDIKEITRNNAISQYQKNRNPFIDHPEYVNRIEDF